MIHNRFRGMALACILACTAVQASLAGGAEPEADRRLQQFFADQVAEIESTTFAGIDSAEAWQERRQELLLQLREMLGLNPWPERTPLNAKTRGKLEGDGYIVERVLFQSRPGLYVTANFYRPSEVEAPLPSVLYVCGHSRQKADGVSFGNKAGYHHHGIWFARNGYTCLIIDTIQLGEIEGVHHGTHNLGQWWWPARGYTPAGTEAWNSIRALDYLESREEVDPKRIGVTGRSGGGAYSWWVAALDERVQAAVPVAGITDLRNHVIDGCVEGHCDCMFMVNRYRWDFGTLAALVAPRPLLISNSHRDRIFPLDGVVRVYRDAEKIYRLLDAEDHLAVHLTAGPHRDTQTLRVGAFAWFNRFLKDSEELIREPAEKQFEPRELRVLAPQETPADERVTNVQEWFVPQAEANVPNDAGSWIAMRDAWLAGLENVPGATALQVATTTPKVEEAETLRVDEVTVRQLTAEIVPPLESHIFLVGPSDSAAVKRVRLCPCEESDAGLSIWLGDRAVAVDASCKAVASNAVIRRHVKDKGELLVIVPPLGHGPSQWSGDERTQTHIRRRFHLLGMTADAIRVAELRGVLEWLDVHPELQDHPVTLAAQGVAAVRGLYAALGQASIERLELAELPADDRNGPILLFAERVWNVPQLLAVASEERTTRVTGSDGAATDYLAAVAEKLGWKNITTE
ncbi:alpha/beta hydrolase family protein [Candidatus Laterigemmans baculatus]|uniref:alpha/beta hydrolase family protein n=1 Tax=Candidatus Laterigemmans baculatus TaxID=2770505 RepID=UPI0013DBF78E|nr:acetylxylan esterase [Candidatus Laterigemmans baculatus]